MPRIRSLAAVCWRRVAPAAALALVCLHAPALSGQLLKPDASAWREDLQRGKQLQQEGRFAEAEEALVSALRRSESFGAEDIRVGVCLNSLGLLYHVQGNFRAAEPLYQRSLKIIENAVGPEHPDVAKILSSLSSLYLEQEDVEKGEPVALRRLAILQQFHGAKDLALAEPLADLSLISFMRGDLKEAERYQRRSLDVLYATDDVEERRIADGLSNLGVIQIAASRFRQAADNLGAAMRIREGLGATKTIDCARDAGHLAEAYVGRMHFAEAESLLEASLDIRRRRGGEGDHAETATVLNSLGEVYRTQGLLAEAETVFRESLSIWTRTAGLDHVETAISQHNLATVLQEQKRYREAERLFAESLSVLRRHLGPDHPRVAQVSAAHEEAQRMASGADQARLIGPGARPE